MLVRTLAATLLFGLSSLLAVAATGYTVPFANYAGFDDFPAYANKHLAPRVKAELEKRGLGILVTSDAFDIDDQTICFARAGLTYLDSTGRTPRAPNRKLVLMAHVDKGARSGSDCRIHELKSLINDLNAHGIGELLADLDELRVQGGTVKVDGGTEIKIQSDLASHDDSMAIARALADTPAVDVLGDQHVQLFVTTANVAFRTNAEIACVATVGLTSVNPDGRQARWPASALSYLNVRRDGNAAGCERDAAIQGLKALFSNSWDSRGIFKDFNLAREDGIPAPNLQLIQQRWNAWNKAHPLARADK